MTQQPYDDPFATPDSVPALTFPSIGTSYSGRVVELPTLVQQRIFETGEPDTWADGNPKLTAVMRLDVDGEQRSLWAKKPSDLFAAIKRATVDKGTPIQLGGTIAVTYIGDKPNEKNPRLNPVKQYRVEYQPPSAFGDAPQQSAQQQQQLAAVSSEPPF